jgi:hypothetical protein
MKSKNQMPLLVATFILFITSSVSHAAEMFTLGYTNLRGTKVPVPLGVDDGIFARHGIQLKMAPVSPGTLGVPKLLAGEIDLFLGNSEPVARAIAVEKKNLAVIAHLGSEGSYFSAGAVSPESRSCEGKKSAAASMAPALTETRRKLSAK